jgi:4-oxalocrotonate tautomerase
MPHVIVKLWPGKSDQQKQKLANAITKAIGEMLHYSEESVSVGFEEIAAKDWTKRSTSPTSLARRAHSTNSRDTGRLDDGARKAATDSVWQSWQWQILTAPGAASAS